MRNTKSIIRILWRYKNKETLTPHERRILRHWLMQSEYNEELFDDLSNGAKWEKEEKEFAAIDGRNTWDLIQSKIQASPVPVIEMRRGWIKYAAAAAILIVGISGYWLITYINKKTDLKSENSVQTGEVIMPPNRSAKLTLKDGRVINLDRNASGTLTIQDGNAVQKKDSVTLIYQVNDASVKATGENTLTTEMGGGYHIVLSDGTNVWLNTATSLTYPASFSAPTRTVSLDGEAYFEVAKNKEKPFIIKTVRGFVRVLGTHFNLQSYPNEPQTTTTLLEGAVSMVTDKDSINIRPGQFASISQSGEITKGTANTDAAIAWRSQQFWFQNASYETIMRQISRWYGVEVIFSRHSDQKFSGILPRDKPLSELLSSMEKEGHVHFTIDGRTVRVSPS